MSIKYILLPLFVEVALTFILWFWMAYYRVTLVRRGEVQPRDVALRQPNWPPHVLQIHNAAHNQIETPMLFLCIGDPRDHHPANGYGLCDAGLDLRRLPAAARLRSRH
jgi:hypothetical protein